MSERKNNIIWMKRKKNVKKVKCSKFTAELKKKSNFKKKAS